MTTTRANRKEDTGRVEAFSDGVFAVAITLLALNLAVPSKELLKPESGLTGALLEQWPVYLAYLLSFLTILVMWVNHHTLFRFIGRTDRLFLLLNGLLLMLITIIPFATELLAAYLLHPEKRVAQVVYSGILLAIAATYNGMWRYASYHGRLLDPEADLNLVKSLTKQYKFGPAIYLVALLLAFFSAELSLALCIILAIFFALPSTITRRASV